MKALATLRRRIETMEELKSIVRTMKSLSAVNVRQYERASASIASYEETVEQGLQVALAGGWGAPKPSSRRAARSPVTGVVVFGSDYGLCGRFNEQVVNYAIERLPDVAGGSRVSPIIAVGLRAADRLEALGHPPAVTWYWPGSAAGLTRCANDILVRLDGWRAELGLDGAILFHNRPEAGGAAPHAYQLLPLSPSYLETLAARPWPGRSLPQFTVAPERLLSLLLRQQLFVSIYRAAADSQASEHAGRLSAMQAAERNLRDQLDELRGEFNRFRQAQITEELLEVVSGYETLHPARQRNAEAS